MRLNRRFVLLSSGGGGGFAIPTFDGSHAVFGDEKQGYIECYSSGLLTFPKKGTVDVFVLGSGMIGYTGDASGYGSSYPSGSMSATGGRGGAGAVGKTSKNIAIEPGAYPIVVGASCSSTIYANVSSAFGVATGNRDTTQIGGTGAKANCSYVDGSGDSWDSTAATGGGNGTSYPFGETSGVFFKRLGAGGGGGGARAAGLAYKSGANGGTIGGGRGGEYSEGNQINCTPGTANTGSGGGGGGAASYGASSLYEFGGGAGGSGIVIVRWGYAA